MDIFVAEILLFVLNGGIKYKVLTFVKNIAAIYALSMVLKAILKVTH